MAWPIGPLGEEDAFVRRSEGLFTLEMQTSATRFCRPSNIDDTGRCRGLAGIRLCKREPRTVTYTC